jgi:DNA-binding transcriptional LysR family regulator
MELRHLRYFMAVAEELNFGRAAKRLHISQPPLTRQIQDLERELGAKLFQRSKRRIQLTEAGRALFVEAQSMLDQADRIQSVVERAGRGETGRLAIGFVNSAIYEKLPDALRAFRSRYPDVELVLREINSGEQVEALREKRIQIGFARGAVQDNDLKSVIIQNEPLVAVLPFDHKLAQEREISIDRLSGDPFILYPRTSRPNFADQILQICVQAGFVPNVVQEAVETQTAMSLVAAGIGVTLAPQSVARLNWPDVTCMPIAPPAPHSNLSALYRSDDESLVSKAFLDVIKEIWNL